MRARLRPERPLARDGASLWPEGFTPPAWAVRLGLTPPQPARRVTEAHGTLGH